MEEILHDYESCTEAAVATRVWTILFSLSTPECLYAEVPLAALLYLGHLGGALPVLVLGGGGGVNQGGVSDRLN
jgi:hypothetical protein